MSSEVIQQLVDVVRKFYEEVRRDPLTVAKKCGVDDEVVTLIDIALQRCNDNDVCRDVVLLALATHMLNHVVYDAIHNIQNISAGKVVYGYTVGILSVLSSLLDLFDEFLNGYLNSKFKTPEGIVFVMAMKRLMSRIKVDTLNMIDMLVRAVAPHEEGD